MLKFIENHFIGLWNLFLLKWINICLQIESKKLAWNAKSKIGSLENATHKAGGGEKKIETVKLDFKAKASSKVGSKDNMKHTPGGGAVKVSQWPCKGYLIGQIQSGWCLL